MAFPMTSGATLQERYMDWVAQQPDAFGAYGVVELHHFGKRGLARKCSDFLVVPLTVDNHREYHASGAIKPWTPAETRATFREWQAESLAAFLERAS